MQQGVVTPLDIRIELTPWMAEIERLQNFPSLIVQTHLYGVDLDPQAAEIATVNLVMRAMADQGKTRRRRPLILNQNIKVGNSLIGAGPADAHYLDHAADLAEMRRLRLKLAAASDGPEHDENLALLEEIDARVNAALDQDLGKHFVDVQTHRPFNWAVEFPEVFLDADGRPAGDTAGFQIVIGNPPWEIVKPDLREFYAQFDPDVESKLAREQAERRIVELDTEDTGRPAAWAAQKARIEAGSPTTATAPTMPTGRRHRHLRYSSTGLQPAGRRRRLAFVIPSGIYTDLGPSRARCYERGQHQYLFSFSNERFFFPESTILSSSCCSPCSEANKAMVFGPRFASTLVWLLPLKTWQPLLPILQTWCTSGATL